MPPKISYSFLCLLLLLTGITTSYSQESEDLDDLFNEQDPSGKNNIIKVNFFSLVAADATVFYERKIADPLSIQIGGGLLLDYKGFEYAPGWENKNYGTGYSVWASIKFYPRRRALEGRGVALSYRRRHYTESNYTLNDIYFDGFTQVYLSDYIVLEASGGFGVRIVETPNKPMSPYDLDRKFAFIMPYTLKLGFII